MSAEPTPENTALRAVPRTHPTPNALVASARRLTSKNLKRITKAKDDRRDDVWDMYDLIGEQRFLANAIGGRVGAAYLYIGRLDPNAPDAPPARVEDNPKIAQALDGFGETPGARAQMLSRMGVNLFQEGDGYFIGFPRDLWAKITTSQQQAALNRVDGLVTMPDPVVVTDVGEEDPGIKLDDLIWRSFSTDEVNEEEGKVKVKIDEAENGDYEMRPEEALIVRVWRPHPRKWWKADAPALSSLPVMRELLGLTMYVSSQIDSRLMGAGIQIVPDSAMKAAREQAGVDPDDDQTNPFIDAMIEAGETAIRDRDSAAAKVPIFVGVPDDVAKSEFWPRLKYDTELDAQAPALRKEALERLAMGQDVPPEILFGVGGLNHWTGWLIKEDTVTTHVEPPLALICDAITSQYLWPVLEQNQMSEGEAHQYVVWYSVAHLVGRPNRLADAKDLHKEGVISDDTLREEAGYTDDDAPTEDLTPTQTVVLDMIRQAPSLAQTIGIALLAEQVQAMLDGSSIPANPAPAEGDSSSDAPVDGPPETDDAPAEPEAVAASAAPEVLTPDAIHDPAPGGTVVHYSGPNGMDAAVMAGVLDRLAQREPMSVNVNVSPPEMPFTVNVEPTPVTVHVEPTPVTVEAPSVDVHVDPTPVHVEAAQVNVSPTPVHVDAPHVTVEAATQTEPGESIIRSGVAGAVDIPDGYLIVAVSATGSDTPGSVTIAGGDAIPVEEFSAFNDTFDKNPIRAIGAGSVVFVNTSSFYVRAVPVT